MGAKLRAAAHGVAAYAQRLEDTANSTSAELHAFRAESQRRDVQLQHELQKLQARRRRRPLVSRPRSPIELGSHAAPCPRPWQALVAAQTRAYVAAFAQKKRKAAQLEGQLQSLLSTVKLMAVKQSQTDEQCADLKDALHKIVTRRSVFVL